LITPRDIARALTDLDRAVAIDPNDPENFVMRAATYQLIPDFDRALADFTEVIRICPELAEAFNDRGTAYANRDPMNSSPAIADFTQAIALDPQFADAYINRG